MYLTKQLAASADDFLNYQKHIHERLTADVLSKGDTMNIRSKPYPTVKRVFLIMKWIAFFLLTGLLTASAEGNAQRISLKLNNVPIEKAFNEIKQQTGYLFVYYKDDLKNAGTVSLNVQQADIKEVLEQLLKGKNLSYSFIDKNIVIRQTPVPLETKDVSSILKENIPFNIEVKGRILDEKNEPVPGASIIVKGNTSKGSFADKDGYFVLQEVDEQATLVISSVNIITREVKVAGKADLGNIIVQLKIDEEQVITVVNTGYQQLPKERATGSFVQMNQEQIENRTDGNIMDRLVGNIPGLQKDTRSDSRFRYFYNIRGRNTFATAMTAPLIVVDNFPYEGDIDLLNPNDIESVTLLRDAAAASIWGAQAGNGVIVITTKKAKIKANKAASVSFNANYATGERPDLYYNRNGMSVSEFIDNEIFLFNQGLYNNDFTGLQARTMVTSPVVDLLYDHRNGLIDDATLQKEIDVFRDIDYRDEIEKYFLQTPVRQNYNLTVSGGTDKASYILSGGYQQARDAVVRGSDETRYNLRSATTIRPTDKLSISVNIMYSHNKRENAGVRYPLNVGGGRSGLYPYARLVGDHGEALPIVNRYNQRFIDTVNQTQLLDWTYRPYDEIDGRIRTFQTTNLNLDLQLGYNLSKSLSAEFRYGYQYQQNSDEDLQRLKSFRVRDDINRFTQINGAAVSYAIPVGATITNTNILMNVHNFRTRINYNKTIDNLHAINAFAGSDISENNGASNTFQNYGYDEDTKTFSYVDYVNRYPVYGNLSSAILIPRMGAYNVTNKRMVSFYTNASYAYDQRYIFSFSARRDASNLLGVKTNELWKPLWSAGFAWDITNESFFDIPQINRLKLRATYGHSGNIVAGNGYYPTLGLVNASTFTSLPYARISQYPDPNRKWEDVRMINAGLDFALFNNRLSGSVEYFNKKSTDLIANDRVDPTSSQNTTQRNVGILKGKGFDIILNSVNLNGKLKWTTDFSISYVKDIVEKYTGDISSTSSIVSLAMTTAAPILEGYTLNSVFSYRSAGLDPQNGDPRGYDNAGHVSKNYINLINDSLQNLIYHGVSLAPYHGFIRNNFSYRRFNLSVNLVFKFGHYFREESVDESAIFNSWILPNDIYQRRWQKPGDETHTYVPSVVYPVQSDRFTFAQGTNDFVQKADFLRLQDIRLAYNFSVNRNNQPIHFQIYATSVQTGFAWRANAINRDPDNLTDRALRNYSLGLNVNF